MHIHQRIELKQTKSNNKKLIYFEKRKEHKRKIEENKLKIN